MIFLGHFIIYDGQKYYYLTIFFSEDIGDFQLLFLRLNRQKIKRTFFDFHKVPGPYCRLQNDNIADCNKSQYIRNIQRFRVGPVPSINRFCRRYFGPPDNRIVVARSGSDFELSFMDCFYTHFFHQVFYPFSAAPGPLRPQLIVNARATISFTVLFINGLYFFFQFKVLLFTATFAAATPLIITTRRDFKYPAHLLNAIVFMLFSSLADDPIVHCWGLATGLYSRRMGDHRKCS